MPCERADKGMETVSVLFLQRCEIGLLSSRGQAMLFAISGEMDESGSDLTPFWILAQEMKRNARHHL